MIRGANRKGKRTRAAGCGRRRPRRGFAMLAAMWLVVIIATIALQFSLTAHERRTLGMNASDRARDRAAASGALATMLARMDYELRTRSVSGGSGGAARALRSSDPWIDADSLYSGDVVIGERVVAVRALDLGSTLNINLINETEIRQLFSFLLGDYNRADALAQSIMDWRDTDELPRVLGGERAEYLRDARLVLPNNAPFRSVDDLVHVMGMTPEILAAVRPFLNTYPFGTRVNLNTAPEAVLRTLPGMTDAIVATILSMRSGGRRIESVSAVIGGAEALSGRSRGRGGSQQSSAQRALSSRATVDTRDLQLEFMVRDTASAQSTRLRAVVQRANNNRAVLRWQQW